MLFRILSTIIANSLALFVAAFFISGFTVEGGIIAYVIAGTTISVLNLIVKPILKLASFPLIFISAGLFLIVINALILFVTQYLIKVMDITGVSITVNNLLTYLLVAIIFGLANWLIHWFLKD